MNSIELKIIGQSLRVSVAEGQEQYYRDIAKELTEQIDEFLKKATLRSEIKATVSVAYKLVLENKQLKEQLSCYENIDNRIDDLINKLDD